jgi:HlyD family secretion protein
MPATRLAILVVSALAIVLGVLGWIKHGRAPAGVAVTTDRAVVRTITQVVTATGKIQPEIEVKIFAEVYGEILELPFREGARVKKGDMLVTIQPTLYQAQVDQQAAAVSMARSQAVHSEAALVKAESDLRQYQDLHQRGLASDADFVSYKTARDTAKADYTAALANVQQAEGLLGQAKDSLAKTVIFSPMDGTVSSRSSEVGESVVAQGNFTGTEIMRVADLTNMEAQVNVNENDIPNVKVGDHAVLTIDAYPDRKFNGFVKEIASSAANSGASSSGSSAQASGSSSDEVTNFLVKIRVADRDIQLRPGMSATADIETQTDRDVVAVPIQCVTVRSLTGQNSDELRDAQAKADAAKSGNAAMKASDRDDARHDRDQLRRVVFVRDGGKVRLRPVETGIADDTWIEVKSGLKPGEEVVSGSYAAISRTLKDGSAVRIDKPKKDDSSN